MPQTLRARHTRRRAPDTDSGSLGSVSVYAGSVPVPVSTMTSEPTLTGLERLPAGVATTVTMLPGRAPITPFSTSVGAAVRHTVGW